LARSRSAAHRVARHAGRTFDERSARVVGGAVEHARRTVARPSGGGAAVVARGRAVDACIGGAGPRRSTGIRAGAPAATTSGDAAARSTRSR
jgi:hypothetical protein